MAGASVLLVYPAVLVGSMFVVGGFASSGSDAVGLVVVGLAAMVGVIGFLATGMRRWAAQEG